MKKRVVLLTVFILAALALGGVALFSQNITLLTLRANHGSLTAAHQLGLIYSTPGKATAQGVKVDYTVANKWFHKAADAGDAQSQYDIAVSYAEGTGVEKDETKAAEWYKKSAAQKYPPAELAVGLCYLYGTGVPKDETYAFNTIRDAMNDGSTTASYHLANLYLTGTGVKKSFSKTVSLLQKYAADNPTDPLPEALNLLGGLYLQGRGVEKDPQTGAKWTWQAAKDGDANAQFNIGRLLLTGYGVKQNDKLAHEMLTKSARQGNAEAIELLKHLNSFTHFVHADNAPN